LAESHLKKLFTDSIVYSAGNIVTRLLPFLLIPVYTHYYSPEQFGVYSLVRAFWFFAAVFYLYGMETSFQKFFIEATEFDKRKKIFSSTLILILITSVVLSIIIFITSALNARLLTGSSSNGYLIRLIAFLLLIDGISRFPMILLNGLQMSKLYTIINVTSVIINVIFNLFFIIILKLGIEAILYAFIIYYTFLFILSFFYCRKYFRFAVDLLLIKQLLKFGYSFLFYGIFLISLDLIDRFFLGYLKGNEEVGIYSACYTIGMVMNLLISGFRTAWMPFFLNLKEEKNNKLIFSRVFSYFCFGGLIVFLAVSLFADDMVRIKIGNFAFMNERYWSGMVIIPYILGAYLMFGLYTNLNIASYFENKIKYLIISSGVGFLSNIILNFILIPPFSIVGAALATLLSYSIMFIVLYYFSQKVFYILYDWKSIIQYAVITLLIYIAFIYLSGFLHTINFSVWLIYIIKAVPVLVLIFVLWKYKILRLRYENSGINASKV
jgi:O-antigen/teichoic acid export membrane protein